ncbi:MAG: MFS transporter [Chloroflexota bacterium]|nr:MFS transporter [Chloroflexota bacterium]MDE2921008.1 MFS transporter [Chloroflexota bacterium]
MTISPPVAEGGVRQWRCLTLLTVAVLLALAPWFSAAAVAPLIQAEWQLRAGAAAWLTLAVQLGFVAGTLVSGVLNIPDRFDASRLFALSAVGAALTTAGLAVIATGPLDGAVLRFLTGAFLAGVYPPGLKLAATWTRRRRGLALSLIVGALTVGSASPHLVRALLDASWRPVVLVTAGLALAAGMLVLGGVRQGPFAAPPARFNPRFALQIVRAPGLRLATLGYLGHQWELYAMWAWVPLFLAQVVAREGGEPGLAAGLAFAVIAVGGGGAVLGGLVADRVGRSVTAAGAMAVSGSAAIAVALLVDARLWVLVPILLVWGISVIADSAQFSAAISELSPLEYVGTALTMQICIGFLLTFVSIHLLGVLVDSGPHWGAAFGLLALGPVFGVVSMLALRRRPEAVRMAGGRR